MKDKSSSAGHDEPESLNQASRRDQALVERERDLERREEHLKSRENVVSTAHMDLKSTQRELQDRERALANKETELQKRQKEREEKERLLREREAAIATRESQSAEASKRLAKEEADLNRRRSDLVARELDASNGFLRQSRETLAPFEARAEALRKETLELEQSLQSRRSEAHRQIAAWKEREVAAVQRSLEHDRQLMEADLNSRREALDREFQALAQERVTHLASLEQQRGQLLSRISARFEEMARENVAELERVLAARRQELTERIDEAELKANLATEQSRILERDREELNRQAEAAIEEHRRHVAADLQQARREVAFLREERDRVMARVQTLEEEKLAFEGRHPGEVLRDLRTLDDEVKHLRQELGRRATDREMLRTRELETQVQQEKVLRREMEANLGRLESELDRRRQASIQLERLRDEREDLQANLAVLRTIVADKHKEYQALLDQVRSVSSTNRTKPGDLEYEKRSGDLTLGPFTVVESGRPPASEKEWLRRLKASIGGTGLDYPPRLVYAFHTCLKIAEWSPLTVLAGVSGTGKSELPRVYARYGGLYFDAVAVQPNWDSPEDVFGFFNYLDSRFNARSLLRGMVQSQAPPDQGGFNHQLLLVLLDEMNLARIELYLSDLLSKWELRRGQEKVKLEFDLGANCDKFEVPLGLNVVFTGTINEDESTQALSDKVLDRGNLLYFPRPKEFHRRDTLALGSQQAPLPFEAWNRWLRTPAALAPLGEQRKVYQDSLERINGHLSRVERGLGHRVWQAFEVYMANHPDVIEAIDSKDEKGQTVALRRAFEDQLVQRLIPKLRGIEIEGRAREECLDRIAEEIRTHASGLKDDFQAALESGRRTFFWRQSDYLYVTD